MRFSLKGIFYLSSLLVLAGNATAAVVAEYDVDGANAGASNVVAVAAEDANATASTMVAFGALGTPFNFPQTFCYLDWPTGALDPSKYYECTITPDGGWGVIYDTITLAAASGGVGEIMNVEVRSSVDGYGSTLAGTTFPANSTWQLLSLDISALAPQLGAVTFRLYFYNAPVNGFSGLGVAPDFGTGQNLFINGQVLEQAVATDAASWGEVKGLFGNPTDAPR